jgi:RNAse (barnase) inhibitor barstar
MNQRFVYFENSFEILDSKIVLIKNAVNKNELFKIYVHSLNFPDYFGNNWDALYDCLTDLSWIEEKILVIIHNDIPLEESERKTYLDLLSDVVLYWNQNVRIKMNICFPNEYKEKINNFFS